MYRMMWSYLFATEDQDSQRRQVNSKIHLRKCILKPRMMESLILFVQNQQEVWKVSTTAGSKRAKKGQDSSTSGRTTKDSEAASKPQSASFLSNPLQVSYTIHAHIYIYCLKLCFLIVDSLILNFATGTKVTEHKAKHCIWSGTRFKEIIVFR